MKVIFALLFPLLIGDAYARFFVDIEMNAKRVIDQNLKLASEVHVTKEIIEHGQKIEVHMKNGYHLLTQIEFLTYSDNPEEIGPTDQLIMRSTVYDPKGVHVGDKEQFEDVVSLTKTKDLEIQTDDLLFTIKIKPYLK